MTSQIVYNGDLRTEATHLQSGSIIETDAPTDNNGKGERFSPTDLVATSVGSCMLTYMGIKAREINVDLKGTTVDITKIMTAAPRRIGEIKVSFTFPASLQLDSTTQKVLENTAMACAVGKSLHPDVKIDVAFGWN